MMDRIGGVGGAGYVPEDDGLDLVASGGAAPDALVAELASDRAELDGIDAAASTGTASRATTPERALADAFTTGSWPAVDAWLDSHPAEVRELVAADRATVEMRVESALSGAYGGGLVAQGRAWWNADAVVDRVEARFTAMAHEAVRERASSDVRAQLAALDGTSPEALLAELRGAPAGTPLAALAEEIGLRGDELDRDRVQLHQRTAREELTLLRDALEGETWNPDELPGTSARVLVSMGLEDVDRGSIAFAAFHRDTMPETTRGVGEAAFEIAHTSVELFEHTYAASWAQAAAATGEGVVGGVGLAGGASIGVALGAIAVGIWLHHEIEEHRMERREAARHLGL